MTSLQGIIYFTLGHQIYIMYMLHTSLLIFGIEDDLGIPPSLIVA